MQGPQTCEKKNKTKTLPDRPKYSVHTSEMQQ